jgi:hypothetical protein
VVPAESGDAFLLQDAKVSVAMSKILDLLSPEWAEKRLAAAKAPALPISGEQEDKIVKRTLRMAMASATPPADPAALEAEVRLGVLEELRKRAERGNQPHARLGLLIARCINICEYEYASGSAPQLVREHCRVACEQALPDLQALESSDWSNRFDDLSQLGLWYIAAVSGDPDLARTVATTSRGPTPSFVNTAILRCALGGDTEGENELAGQLKAAYSADFPPQLTELPLGVIARDPAQIAEGVRKIGVKFHAKWDPEKHRAYYEKRQPKAPGKHHPNGTWEQFMETTKGHLFGLHWIFSWWAIAWLQVARHRGLSEVFEDKNRKAFSEWVPLAMVETD